MESYSASMATPLGCMRASCAEHGLTSLYFVEYASASAETARHPLLEAARDWLLRYFAGCRPAARELPLFPEGTPYQRSVWDALLKIPYGETCSYEDVAKTLARSGQAPGSPRSCGSAIGKNPIGIIIPCHRVIRKNGSLGGYAGGMERKRFLLRHEQAILA